MAQNSQTTDADVAKVIGRFEVWKRLTWVPIIAVLYVPFSALEPIAQDFAGKDTHLNVAIAVNLSISIVLSGTVVALLIKNHRQRAELKRQRDRLYRLEAEVEDMKALPKARA